MSKDPGTMNEPVMDGATDDMSDGGTPKAEAADLQQAGHDDEIQKPDTQP
jgi:hypothetical protein